MSEKMDGNGVVESAKTFKNGLLDIQWGSITEIISKAIKAGNSIEIHPAKGGVRIYEVKKKVMEIRTAEKDGFE